MNDRYTLKSIELDTTQTVQELLEVQNGPITSEWRAKILSVALERHKQHCNVGILDVKRGKICIYVYLERLLHILLRLKHFSTRFGQISSYIYLLTYLSTSKKCFSLREKHAIALCAIAINKEKETHNKYINNYSISI